MSDDSIQRDARPAGVRPRWSALVGATWVPARRVECSPTVGGVMHVELPATIAHEACDGTGLIRLRPARGAPSLCGQVLQFADVDAKTTGLVVSPLGFVERDADAGAPGDDFLLDAAGAPIRLEGCLRLRSCCGDGNHVRIDVATTEWIDRLRPSFERIDCPCAERHDLLAAPHPLPGICRRIARRSAEPFEMIRLRGRARLFLSIDLANVMPTRTVLIGHERGRVPLTDTTN